MQSNSLSSDGKSPSDGSTMPSTISTVLDELDIGKLPKDMPYGETHNDFYGFPSYPLSIHHTGPAWPMPTGPEAYRIPTEARPICIHPISSVWHELGEKIYKYLDSIGLKWTSIDPVRFAKVGQEPGPLFLWVGVLPGTLSSKLAKGPALRCKEILSEYGIIDVEIAFRESIYTRYAGPQLLDVDCFDEIANVRTPFTHSLGLQIASKAFSSLEGTGCLYLCEGGGSDRVFLLTARHVALPPDEYPNELYQHKKDNVSRFDVIHLGAGAFSKAVDAISKQIVSCDFYANMYQSQSENMEENVEGEQASQISLRRWLENNLEEVTLSKKLLSEFRHLIMNQWSLEDQRILGHIVYSPPLSVSTSRNSFTEDWALIEIDREKFSWESFQGNGIYLEFKDKSFEFKEKMYPHPQAQANFKYPSRGLLQIRGFVKDDELRHPTMRDENGEEHLMVFKNGASSGFTFGRATGIGSFVREYKNNTVHSTSMEIAVYSYSNKDRTFSAPGDSGAAVVDANCRVVGMIVGGAGKTDLTDVTYVTPYWSLDESIKKAFPHSHLFPIRDATSA